jgi:polyisoprenoid-binding protein YceI
MGALCAQPVSYSIEPSERGRFELKVYKTGLYSGKVHTFVFDRYEGTFTFDQDNPRQSTAEFVVESDSIRCLDDWVSEKDRGKILKEARGNMLAVDKYPQIRFEAKGLTHVEGTTFTAEGRLTIRDQTRTVQVTVEHIGIADGAGLQGSAVVSLKDFGLDPPSAAFGLIGTKSEMDVEFAFDLTPAKE